MVQTILNHDEGWEPVWFTPYDPKPQTMDGCRVPAKAFLSLGTLGRQSRSRGNEYTRIFQKYAGGCLRMKFDGSGGSPENGTRTLTKRLPESDFLFNRGTCVIRRSGVVHLCEMFTYNSDIYAMSAWAQQQTAASFDLPLTPEAAASAYCNQVHAHALLKYQDSSERTVVPDKG
ncbi:hypothetical protein MMC30_007167 [Trapelia coarctata]|nr:hypothetical protein [Trapelia coarctata]